MNIGQKLYELRTAKGFSQGDIEKRTGLLRCYTSRVENGHTVPSLETLEKYAAALEVELYQLFYEGGGKPKPAASKPLELAFQERVLVDTFRKLPRKEKRQAIGLIERLVGSAPAAGSAA